MTDGWTPAMGTVLMVRKRVLTLDVDIGVIEIIADGIGAVYPSIRMVVSDELRRRFRRRRS